MKIYASLFLIVCSATLCTLKAQSKLNVKFLEPERFSCFINGKPIPLSSSNEILLKSESSIKVLFEVKMGEKTISQKQFNYKGDRTYILEQNAHNEYKFRLRTNAKLEEPVTILQSNFGEIPIKPIKKDTVLPIKVVKDHNPFTSLTSALGNTNFVFEKIRLSNNYIQDQKSISSTELIEICSFLTHDYAKWQIVKNAIPVLSDVENLNTLKGIFETPQYQEKIIALKNEVK